MAESERAGIGAVGPLTPAEIREIGQCGELLREVREEIRLRIVGQERVLEELLICFFAEGHCLIVGVPGLAKTLLVSTLSEVFSLSFKRIQFTPDLMPTDITGATIIAEDRNAGNRNLRFMKGPIFANLILADEINRTPPKTQSALMEAMEERQITAHGKRHRLERPFYVLATQNPIEQEGTYPLPVSQMDRFLFNVLIDYPTTAEEFTVMELTTSAYQSAIRCLVDRDRLVRLMELGRRIEISDRLVDYATRIVRASRPAHPGAMDFVREWVAWGGGPRAIQSVILGAKSRALLEGRFEVLPADIHRVVFPALRHRILLNYHGEAEGVATDEIIEKILLSMPGGLYHRPAPEIRRPPRWKLLARLFGA